MKSKLRDNPIEDSTATITIIIDKPSLAPVPSLPSCLTVYSLTKPTRPSQVSFPPKELIHLSVEELTNEKRNWVTVDKPKRKKQMKHSWEASARLGPKPWFKRPAWTFTRWMIRGWQENRRRRRRSLHLDMIGTRDEMTSKNSWPFRLTY